MKFVHIMMLFFCVTFSHSIPQQTEKNCCRNHPPHITNQEVNQCIDGDNLVEQSFKSSLDVNRWRDITCCDAKKDQDILKLDLYHEKPFPFHKFRKGCYPLSAMAFQRSLRSPLKPDMRLLNVICKVISRLSKEIVIVTIGGSVAAGNKAGGKQYSSSTLFVQWLTHRYPHIHFVHHHLAVPATDSFWRLANMQSVAEKDPDLVLYDYTTNDIGASFTFSESKFRTVTESLVREILQLPKQPALIQLVLFRSLDVGSEIEGDLAQANIIEPIASLYQYTVVSYRDAVWPVHSRPPVKESGVFDGEWVHPYWYVHQLIADLLAYAWTNAEFELVSTSANNTSSLQLTITLPSIPPARYSDDTVEALKSCPSHLTNYEHESWSQYQPASSSPWSYVSAFMKEGWQYEVRPILTGSASDRIDHSQGASNDDMFNDERRQLGQHLKKMTHKQVEQAASHHEIDHELMSIQEYTRLLESHKKLTQVVSNPCGYYHGISFKVQFGSHSAHVPSLLVSFLKSYEHFGRAMVILDSNEALIENILKTQYNYFKVCLNHYIGKVRADFTKKKNMREDSASSAPLIQARVCNQMLSGEYDLPFTLNGHWSDPSSQTSVSVFNTQYVLHRDAFLFDTPVYVPHEGVLGDSQVKSPTHIPLTTPGWHNLTIALLKEGVHCRNSSRHGGALGSANNLVGFDYFEQQKNYSKFKILGIKTC